MNISHHLINTIMSTPEGLDRSKAWMAVFVLSIVILIVFADIKSGNYSNGKEKYIIACCSLGITFGFIFTAAAYTERLKRRIYGNSVETTFAIINIALWSVGVGILQSPKNNLANTTAQNVNAATDSISNANLYFASWIVFAASSSIVASILKDKGLFDAKVSWAAMSKTMNRWFLLLVASLVVLITSTLLESDTPRVKFATSVGAIGAALPFLVLFFAMFRCALGVIFQLVLSTIMVALYGFEVGTFYLLK